MRSQNANGKTTTITVDLEVHSAIENEKRYKREPLNDVLRRKYGLEVK